MSHMLWDIFFVKYKNFLKLLDISTIMLYNNIVDLSNPFVHKLVPNR